MGISKLSMMTWHFIREATVASLLGGVTDQDQSGFISARSVAKNFVYATEVVQCCHCRRAPTLVLMLNFTKAFDSINWTSLRAIMEARGFLERWCTWMEAIFSSSRSAVLLNGVPGRWIDYKRGLCQGGPLSPCLFLLVADVLQKMIQKDDVLAHPLVDRGRPPVLQYADDTLILLRADVPSAARLKLILDQFAAANGLVINFHKSTLVPMHVDAVVLSEITAVLGCCVEGFPQTYLGLPCPATSCASTPLSL